MFLTKILLIKKLQEANTHLGSNVGSKAALWSRFKMQRNQFSIYGFRGTQPIIDLDKTILSLRRAHSVIQYIIQNNGHLLLVNTNPKYNKIIQKTATITKQSYINHKWVGGLLTNWNHMQKVQEQFQKTKSLSEGSFQISFQNMPRFKKMKKCFEGTFLQKKDRLGCILIFNANQNSTTINEAHLNQIPVISLVDSSISTALYQKITYPIPANGESTRFIYLFCNCLIKTILSA